MRKLSIIHIVFFTCIYISTNAQWIQMNGPYSENILKILSKNDTLFAFGNDKIYWSSNSGENWVGLPYAIENDFLYVSKIANQDSLFIINTNESIYKSIDFGITWQQLFIPPYDSIGWDWDEIEYLYPHFNEIAFGDSLIFATTDNGLYKIHYSDTSWQRLDTIEHNWLGGIYIEDSIIICGTIGKGVFMSVDYGLTWIYNNENIEGIISELFKMNNSIYAISHPNIYKSDDYGLTWINANDILPINQVIYNIFFKDEILYVNVFDSVLYRSHDYGETYELVNNGLPIRSEYNSIQDVFCKGDTIYVGFEYSGIFKSCDVGKNWEQKSVGMEHCLINEVICFGDTLITYSHSQGPGLLKSCDAGLNWKTINVPEISTTIYDLEKDKNNLYIVHHEGISISYNKGESWEKILEGEKIYSVEADNNFIICGTTKHRTFKSYDYGENWDTTYYDDIYGAVDRLLVKGNDVLVGGFDLYLSSDLGQTWNNIWAPKHPYIGSFDFDGQTMIVATQKGVFSSYDRGQTWDLISNNLGESIFPTDTYILDSIVFQGFYDRGIKYSIIGEYNWKDYNHGADIKYSHFNSNGKYFFSSSKSGLWRRPIFESVSIKEEIFNNNEFVIWPNPVDNILNIRAENEKIESIIIYNLIGNQIIKKNINNNSCTIDLAHLSSGCYFVSMESITGVHTYRVIKL